MESEWDGDFDGPPAVNVPQAGVSAGISPTCGLPEIVSSAYAQAPAPLRTKLIEYLLGPIGPLALLAVAGGAFARFLYWLPGDTAEVSIDDISRITPTHILELARYVEQCSPSVLLQISPLVTGGPIEIATIGGSALLIGLMDWMKRRVD